MHMQVLAEVPPPVSVATQVLAIGCVLPWILFNLWALIDCAKNTALLWKCKVLWLLFVLSLPPIGGFFYLLFGRNGRHPAAARRS